MSFGGFFKQVKDKVYSLSKNDWLQLYNLGVFAFVLWDFLSKIHSTDEAENNVNVPEYAFDMIVHVAQALLAANSPRFQKLATLVLNGYRLVDIPVEIANGTATVPNAAAFADVVNHIFNIMGTTALLIESETKEVQAQKPKLG